MSKFPFPDHLTFSEAEFVQSLRRRIRDDTILSDRPHYAPHIPYWKLVNFMRRNPRPARDVA